MVWIPSRPVFYAALCIIFLPLPFFLCAPLHVSTTDRSPACPAPPSSDTCPPTAARDFGCDAVQSVSLMVLLRSERRRPLAKLGRLLKISSAWSGSGHLARYSCLFVRVESSGLVWYPLGSMCPMLACHVSRCQHAAGFSRSLTVRDPATAGPQDHLHRPQFLLCRYCVRGVPGGAGSHPAQAAAARARWPA